MKHIGGVKVQHQLFLTSAIDEVSGQYHAAVVLSTGEEPSVPLNRNVDWPQSSFWTFRSTGKALTSAGDRISDRPSNKLVTILSTVSFSSTSHVN